jgi:hypothetical protein
MKLPSSDHLPVHKLASTFSNTSATYKFYWLLAIIDSAENGLSVIPKRELFAKMISGAWYTVNYFHVSFGKQDLIQHAILEILVAEKLTIDIKRQDLLGKLLTTGNPTTARQLKHFDKNVPHWFLSPWFKKKATETDGAYKKRIYGESQLFSSDVPYALHEEHIEINPAWKAYLQANARMLKDFCFWNLALFLQARNPSVPDIPGKLFQPPFRGTLQNQRKNYWDIIFNELGSIDCIFTNNALRIDRYALDHFIPYAFVSHNLIWNLVPIDVNFNASKSDSLPLMNEHFDKFYKLQKLAFEIIRDKNPQNKFLQDYLSIYPDINTASGFGYDRYKESILPLITIARNNGFESLNL